MPPFVPDGVYEIRNVEYSRVVADLINDRPTNVNDKWCIKNVGDGGNEITIEYGIELVGSDNSTVWTVVRVDVGYYLQSPGAQYVWQLTRDGDYGPMELSPFTGQDNTKWTFELVN